MNLTHSVTEVNAINQQNVELKDTVEQMEDEIQYLRLKERKIMYLVHLLQGKGYPVS